jgi:hypothetical protein
LLAFLGENWWCTSLYAITALKKMKCVLILCHESSSHKSVAAVNWESAKFMS